MVICSECPRRCRAIRREDSGEGFCKMGTLPKVSRIAPHYGEEPCISGTRGTAAVFFSGCSLACVFCQNERISHEGFGKTLTVEALRARMDAVAASCDTVSLVNPTHYTHILPALLEQPFGKPVVYNTGGYDSIPALHALEGKIDVYLPDLKYRSPLLSARYSGAPDYFDTASAAILEMLRQTGPFRTDEDGILQRGVMIRHLVLPGYSADSLAVLRWCRDHPLRGGAVLGDVPVYPLRKGEDHAAAGSAAFAPGVCPGDGLPDGQRHAGRLYPGAVLRRDRRDPGFRGAGRGIK